MANCSIYSLFRSEAFKNNKLSGSFIDLLCTAINNGNDTEFKKNLVKLLGLPDSVLKQSQDYMSTVSNLEAYLDNLTDEALVELGNKIKDKFTKKESNIKVGPRKLTGEDIYEANDKTYLDFDKIGTWNEREIINLFTDDKIKSKIKANELFEYWKELVNNYKGNNPLEKFDFTYIITKLNFGEKNGSIIKYVEKDEDKVVLHDLFLRHFFGIRADGDKIADNDFNRKIQDEKYFKQYLQELLGEIEPDIPADNSSNENLSIDNILTSIDSIKEKELFALKNGMILIKTKEMVNSNIQCIPLGISISDDELKKINKKLGEFNNLEELEKKEYFTKEYKYFADTLQKTKLLRGKDELPQDYITELFNELTSINGNIQNYLSSKIKNEVRKENTKNTQEAAKQAGLDQAIDDDSVFDVSYIKTASAQELALAREDIGADQFKPACETLAMAFTNVIDDYIDELKAKAKQEKDSLELKEIELKNKKEEINAKLDAIKKKSENANLSKAEQSDYNELNKQLKETKNELGKVRDTIRDLDNKTKFLNEAQRSTIIKTLCKNKKTLSLILKRVQDIFQGDSNYTKEYLIKQRLGDDYKRIMSKTENEDEYVDIIETSCVSWDKVEESEDNENKIIDTRDNLIDLRYSDNYTKENFIDALYEYATSDIAQGSCIGINRKRVDILGKHFKTLMKSAFYDICIIEGGKVNMSTFLSCVNNLDSVLDKTKKVDTQTSLADLEQEEQENEESKDMAVTEDVYESISDGETLREKWQMDDTASNVWDSLGEEIKHLLATLHPIGISDNIEKVNSNASEGNKSYGKSLKNFFGFQRSVNPMQYYCQIKDVLIMMQNPDDMMTKLEGLAKCMPEINVIIDKLKKDRRLKYAFYKNFNKDRRDFYLVDYKEGNKTPELVNISRSDYADDFMTMWRDKSDQNMLSGKQNQSILEDVKNKQGVEFVEVEDYFWNNDKRNDITLALYQKNDNNKKIKREDVVIPAGQVIKVKHYITKDKKMYSDLVGKLNYALLKINQINQSKPKKEGEEDKTINIFAPKKEYYNAVGGLKRFYNFDNSSGDFFRGLAFNSYNRGYSSYVFDDIDSYLQHLGIFETTVKTDYTDDFLKGLERDFNYKEKEIYQYIADVLNNVGIDINKYQVQSMVEIYPENLKEILGDVLTMMFYRGALRDDSYFTGYKESNPIVRWGECYQDIAKNLKISNITKRQSIATISDIKLNTDTLPNRVGDFFKRLQNIALLGTGKESDYQPLLKKILEEYQEDTFFYNEQMGEKGLDILSNTIVERGVKKTTEVGNTSKYHHFYLDILNDLATLSKEDVINKYTNRQKHLIRQSENPFEVLFNNFEYFGVKVIRNEETEVEYKNWSDVDHLKCQLQFHFQKHFKEDKRTCVGRKTAIPITAEVEQAIFTTMPSALNWFNARNGDTDGGLVGDAYGFDKVLYQYHNLLKKEYNRIKFFSENPDAARGTGIQRNGSRFMLFDNLNNVEITKEFIEQLGDIDATLFEDFDLKTNDNIYTKDSSLQEMKNLVSLSKKQKDYLIDCFELLNEGKEDGKKKPITIIDLLNYINDVQKVDSVSFDKLLYALSIYNMKYDADNVRFMWEDMGFLDTETRDNGEVYYKNLTFRKAIPNNSDRSGYEVDVNVKEKEKFAKILYDYTWNTKINMISMAEMLAGDASNYKDWVDFQKRFKEVVAPGYRPADLEGLGNCRAIVLADEDQPSPNIVSNSKMIKAQLDAGLITLSTAKSMFEAYMDYKSTDGMAWRTLDSFVKLQRAMVEWDDSWNDIVDEIKAGNKTIDELEYYINAKKPYVFDNTYQDIGGGQKTKVGIQYKNQEGLLWDRKNYKQDALIRASEIVGIDVFEYASCSKVYTKNPVNINYYTAEEIKNHKSVIDKNNKNEEVFYIEHKAKEIQDGKLVDRTYKIYALKGKKRVIDGVTFHTAESLRREAFDNIINGHENNISDEVINSIVDNFIITNRNEIIKRVLDHALVKDENGKYLTESGSFGISRNPEGYYDVENKDWANLEKEKRDIQSALSKTTDTEEAAQLTKAFKDAQSKVKEKKAEHRKNVLAQKNSLKVNTQNVHDFGYDKYSIQTAVHEHFADKERNQGTQLRKLIIGNMDREVKINNLGKEKTGKEIEKEYIENEIRIILHQFKKLVKDLSDNEGKKLIKILNDTASKSPDRVGANFMDFIRVDENGKPIFDLKNPFIADKLGSTLVAKISKAIQRWEMPGGQLVQSANIGSSNDYCLRYKDKEGNLLYTQSEWEDPSKCNLEEEEEALRKIKAEYEEKYGNDDAFTYYSHDMNQKSLSIAYGECMSMLPMDSMYDRIKSTKDGVTSYDMRKLTKEERMMIGYRVPTEGKCSMIPLIIKKASPKGVSSQIVMPNDWVVISGSDFDIDKLYIDRFSINEKVKLDIKKAEDRAIIEKWFTDNNVKIPRFDNKKEDSKINYKKALEYIIKKEPKYLKDYRNIVDFSDKNAYSIHNKQVQIAWDILTNHEMSWQTLKPQGFDNVKRMNYTMQILKSGKTKQAFFYLKDKLGYILEGKNENDLNEILFAKDKDGQYIVPDDIVKKVAGAYARVVGIGGIFNPFFRTQNMAGLDMVGITANQQTNHAEYQHTDLFGVYNIETLPFEIDKNYFIDQSFADEEGYKKYIGRKVKGNIHHDKNKKIRNRMFKLGTLRGLVKDSEGNLTKGEYISFALSEFQGAAVDNVKLAVLANINLNTITSDGFFYMIRSGMPIDMATTFMNQPIIEQLCKFVKNNTPDGRINKDVLEAYVNKLLEQDFNSLSPEELEDLTKLLDQDLTSNNKNDENKDEEDTKNYGTFKSENLIKNIGKSLKSNDNTFAKEQINILNSFLALSKNARKLQTAILSTKESTSKAALRDTPWAMMEKKDKGDKIKERELIHVKRGSTLVNPIATNLKNFDIEEAVKYYCQAGMPREFCYFNLLSEQAKKLVKDYSPIYSDDYQYAIKTCLQLTGANSSDLKNYSQMANELYFYKLFETIPEIIKKDFIDEDKNKGLSNQDIVKYYTSEFVYEFKTWLESIKDSATYQDNFFLKNLIVKGHREASPTIEFRLKYKATEVDRQNCAYDWARLFSLTSNGKQIGRNMATKLFVYTMINSALKNTPTSLKYCINSEIVTEVCGDKFNDYCKNLNNVFKDNSEVEMFVDNYVASSNAPTKISLNKLNTKDFSIKGKIGTRKDGIYQFPLSIIIPASKEKGGLYTNNKQFKGLPPYITVVQNTVDVLYSGNDQEKKKAYLEKYKEKKGDIAPENLSVTYRLVKEDGMILYKPINHGNNFGRVIPHDYDDHLIYSNEQENLISKYVSFSDGITIISMPEVKKESMPRDFNAAKHSITSIYRPYAKASNIPLQQNSNEPNPFYMIGVTNSEISLLFGASEQEANDMAKAENDDEEVENQATENNGYIGEGSQYDKESKQIAEDENFCEAPF